MNKEVSTLNDDKIKRQVNNFLSNNLDIDYIKQETLSLIETEQYYKIDNNYISTIDIYINDQAGFFITKETIEFFGFYVDEDRYKNEFSIYVDISDIILNYASEYLNNKINIDVNYQFIIDSDFKLNCYIDSDYIPVSDYSFLIDILTDQFYNMDNKKLLSYYNRNKIKELINQYKPVITNNKYENKQDVINYLFDDIQERLSSYIPIEYKNKCIVSSDADIATSLAEYCSLWMLNNDNIKLINSNYDYDNNKIIYQAILFNNDHELLELINEEIDKNVFNFIGYQDNKFNLLKKLIYLRKHDKEQFYYECLHLISSILDYYGLNFKHKTANIPYEILNKEVLN